MLINPIARGYQYGITSFSFKAKKPLKSLAKLLSAKKIDSEFACFLYYKLGMYKSVINHPYNGGGWRGNFAKAIAHAAAGEYKLALKKVDYLCDVLKISTVFIEKLSVELAPYMPEVSLKLIDKTSNNNLFKLALLTSLNKRVQAQKLITLLNQKDIRVDFYRLNLTDSTNIKLMCLNKILQYYQLEPVQLIDESKQLSAYNIQTDKVASEKKGTLVSILVTSHNSAEFIDVALRSLLNQTYRNIEIIVIDDASTDNTVGIIKTFSQADSRVKVLELPMNVGTFVAKTEGIKLAEGEFVICHDSDDWAHPRKIEMQIDPLLRNPNLISTTSQWIRMCEDGSLYTRKIYPSLRLNPASPMFRKDIVLAKAGYWDQVRTGADSEFLARLKMIFGNQAVYQVKKPLTIGAHRKGSLMTDGITGYSSLKGSNERIQYLETWRYKHLKLVEKF